METYSFCNIRALSVYQKSKLQGLQEVNKNRSFINLFEELKLICNKIAGSGSKTNFEVDRASDRNFIIKRNKRFINQIKDIRNLLQHPSHEKPYDAFEVSQQLVDDLAELINILKNPKKASDICVPLNQIYSIAEGSRVIDATNTMQSSNFTHVPIIDADSKVVGVFSENSLFSYFCSDDIIDAGESLLIRDIMQFCSMEHRTETFKFIKPNTDIERVYDLFTSIESPNRRVGALFITASGKRNDRLTGLITAWDILSNIVD